MILPLDYDYEEDELSYIEYRPEDNAFYMANYVFYYIFRIMTPNELIMFKKNKQDILVRTNRGDLYYITYDDYDEEEDLEDKYN